MARRRGRPKEFVALGFVATSIVSLSVIAAWFFLNQPGRHIASLPPQGLYEECPPAAGSRCVTRLRQMASAGFELVLNYNQLDGTADQEVAYAQQAHALGMKVIWPLNNPALWNGTDARQYFGALARTCSCADNAGFIRYVVRLVKNLPATWGYYVGDEVSSDNHARVKATADLIAQLDPVHERLYVAGADSSSLGASLAPFADTADVLGADYYPIGTTEPIEATADIASSIRSIASGHHKQAMMVLQAFSLSQYAHAAGACSPSPGCERFPTRDEMRQMRDFALQYAHPRLLLWYSFYDIFRSGNPVEHWNDLKAAAGVHPTTSTA